METIALFGGSFDPPHIGHKAVIESLLELKEIDRVVVMPTFLNPFKSLSHAPSELRLKWLKDIFFNKKNVLVDDYEVSLGRKVATISTVTHLLKKYKKIYLVIGADNLETLREWTRYHELKDLVTFIVATRDDIEIPNNFMTVLVKEEISSSVLRNVMDKTKLPKECANEIAQHYKEKNER